MRWSGARSASLPQLREDGIQITHFETAIAPFLRPAARARVDQHSAACGVYAVAGEFWDRAAHRADVDLDR